jgi:hypothetical protein
MNSYWLERVGSLMAGGGIAYATYVGTKDMPLNAIWETGLRQILLQKGPIEICAVGILLWIVGKWRKTVVTGNR